MEKRPKILILGNGFGGIYTLISLHKLAHKEQIAELFLVGEKNYFLFTPLLHEVATGGLNPLSTVEPVRKFLGCCLNEFHLGTAKLINTRNRTVEVDDSILPYDYLVIATGAETNFFNVAGAPKHAFELKSMVNAIRIKNHILRIIERASVTTDETERKKLLRFVVVGGGPTGVELVAEMEELIKETFSHYYSAEIFKNVSFILVQRGKELVPQFDAKIRRFSLNILRRKNIEVRLETGVKEVGPDYALLDNGEKLDSHTIIWVAGIKPRLPEFDIDPERAPDGRLLVNEFLELKNHKNIFAIGDAAAFALGSGFLPALAQVAEKEGKALAKNLMLAVKGRKPEKFIYRHSGSLLSLGQWNAVAQIKSVTFSGPFAWWLWRTIYLFKFISFRKKIRVALDWTVNLFSPRDISEF